MRRLTILSLLGLLLQIGVVSGLRAQSVGELFVSMPDSLIPILPDSTLRADLLKSPGETLTNPFGGEVKVLSETEGTLRLALDSSTELELGLLSYKKRNYICLIATSTIVPAQSVVAFYDTEWHRTQEPLLEVPDAELFLTDSESNGVKSALAEQGHLHWVASFDKDNPELLTLRITSYDDQTAHSLRPEIREKLHPVQMRWRRGRYVLYNN